MKQGLMLFVFAWVLLACISLSVLNSYNCGQGICTTVQVIEPVRPNEPATVTITVTADRDIPDLGISLTHDYGIEVEDPPPSEKAAVTYKEKNAMGWAAPVKANQPARFTRKVRLPPRDGLYQIVAYATIPGKGPVATDSVYISLTPDGGTVYRSGTSIPTPATPIRAITLSATPLPRTPTPVRTPTRAPYP